MREISAKLQALASEAIDLALDCFIAGEQNPFILLVDKSGQYNFIDVKDVEGKVNDQLVETAKQIVSKVSDRLVSNLFFGSHLLGFSFKTAVSLFHLCSA